jgi:hypothetical protein
VLLIYLWLTITMAEALLPKVLCDQYAGVLPRWHPGPYRLAGRAGRAVVRRLSVSARTDPLAAHAIRRELDDHGPGNAIPLLA